MGGEPPGEPPGEPTEPRDANGLGVVQGGGCGERAGLSPGLECAGEEGSHRFGVTRAEELMLPETDEWQGEAVEWDVLESGQMDVAVEVGER